MYSLKDAYNSDSSPTLAEIIIGVGFSVLFSISIFLIIAAHDNAETRQLHTTVAALKAAQQQGIGLTAALDELSGNVSNIKDKKAIQLNSIEVKDSAQFDGTATFEKNIDTDGNLTVGGSATIAKNVGVNGELSVVGSSAFEGTIAVDEIQSIDGSANLEFVSDGSGTAVQASNDLIAGGSIFAGTAVQAPEVDAYDLTLENQQNQSDVSDLTVVGDSNPEDTSLNIDTNVILPSLSFEEADGNSTLESDLGVIGDSSGNSDLEVDTNFIAPSLSLQDSDGSNNLEADFTLSPDTDGSAVLGIDAYTDIANDAEIDGTTVINPTAAEATDGNPALDVQGDTNIDGTSLPAGSTTLNVKGSSTLDASSLNPAGPSDLSIAASNGGSLTSGTEYYYEVTYLNAQGVESLPSDEVTQVSNLNNNGQSTFTLSWQAVQGATGYRLYRGTSSGDENEYISTNTTSYRDNGAGMFANGSPPQETDALSVYGKTLIDGSALASGSTTLGVTGTADIEGTTEITDASSSSTALEVTGSSYLTGQGLGSGQNTLGVIGATTLDGSSLNIDGPGDLTATNVSGGSLTANTSYYYEVTYISSTNKNVESEPSAEAYAATTTGNQTIDLSWPDMGSNVTYRIYRGTSSGQEDEYCQFNSSSLSNSSDPSFADNTAAFSANNKCASYGNGTPPSSYTTLSVDGETSIDGSGLTAGSTALSVQGATSVVGATTITDNNSGQTALAVQGSTDIDGGGLAQGQNALSITGATSISASANNLTPPGSLAATATSYNSGSGGLPNSIMEDGETVGITYYYEVTWVNPATGQESSPSNEASYYLAPSGNNQINLSWTVPTGFNATTDDFRLYRTQDPNASGLPDGSGSEYQYITLPGSSISYDDINAGFGTPADVVNASPPGSSGTLSVEGAVTINDTTDPNALTVNGSAIFGNLDVNSTGTVAGDLYDEGTINATALNIDGSITTPSGSSSGITICSPYDDNESTGTINDTACSNSTINVAGSINASASGTNSTGLNVGTLQTTNSITVNGGTSVDNLTSGTTLSVSGNLVDQYTQSDDGTVIGGDLQIGDIDLSDNQSGSDAFRGDELDINQNTDIEDSLVLGDNLTVDGSIDTPNGGVGATPIECSGGGNTSPTGGCIGTHNTCNSGSYYAVYGVDDGIITSGGCETLANYPSGNDLAEYYPSTEDLSPGELVSIDSNNSQYVIESSTADDSSAIGIVSTNPGETLGTGGSGMYAIALAGRVPVDVNNQGGAIEPGDYLTSSSTPGYAMKASPGDKIVAQALEGFSGSSGSITAFIEVSGGDSSQTTQLQSTQYATQGGNASFSDLNVSGNATINNLSVTGTATLQTLIVSGDTTLNNVSINGHLSGNNDTRGTITIPAGSTSESFNFTTPYASTPIVVASPTDTATEYSITPSDTGFSISLPTPESQPVTFDYLVEQ